MWVRASAGLMLCTPAHLTKFVRAPCVNFHTLLNNNKNQQIQSNPILHVFTLNTNFPDHEFLVGEQWSNGRIGTVFRSRVCRPPTWMRERVRSRIKYRPGHGATTEEGNCSYLLPLSHRAGEHSVGSGNGLLPDGTKPLPEPMLTYRQLDSVALT